MSMLDTLFGKANMRCTICETSTKVGCDCWTECSCGWSFQKGTSCNNPECGGDPGKPLKTIMTGSGKL